MNARVIISMSLAILCCWRVAPQALEIGEVVFTTDSVGKVMFSHSGHLKKKSRTAANVSCKGCHNYNMLKGVRYTMAQMAQGGSCGQCHNGKKAFALSRCTGCHKVKDITLKVAQTGSVRFRHSTHLKKSADCAACHTTLFKISGNAPTAMSAMEKGASCGACHNGKRAFSLSSCTACHPVKDRTFVVKEAGNVVFSHISHITRNTCGDCHPAIFEPKKGKAGVTMAAMETGSSCGACHDGKTAFTVKENCATCHKT